MKKSKKAKIIILFAIILCVASCLFTAIRERYLKTKIENALAEIKENKDTETSMQENDKTQIETEINNKTQDREEKDIHEIYSNGIIGEIIIPSINVEAPIKEGVTADIINYTVRTF